MPSAVARACPEKPLRGTEGSQALPGDVAIPQIFIAMLTLEMLFALLQGLPADHLDHLDRPWYLLARRIQSALKEGLDPYSALQSAVSNSPEWERRVFLRAYLQEEPVLALPDLTPRQKDALIALRAAGACSLPQLSRVLMLDRSYTRRLLEVLIEKGYAVKYFRRDGTYYLAISSPLTDQTKTDITGLMQAFKQALLASQSSSPNDSSPTKSQIKNLSRASREAATRDQQSAIINSPPSTTPTQTTAKSHPSRESRLSRMSRLSRESPRSRSSSASPVSRKSRPNKHARPPRPP